MVTHIKTTVEITDHLLNQAKEIAANEKTTLRALIEEGLHQVLAQRKKPHPFKLKDKSVSGKGLQSGISEGNWDQIRELIYQGRGT